jgi:type IV pilus assembly protein PilQ
MARHLSWIAALALAVAAAGTAQTSERRRPTPVPPAAAFATVDIDGERPRYSGDPISLSLKDADIRNVIKTFATLTRLNIVVDPTVRGSVTVELRDVPWDQAFELILTINDLDYGMLHNVVYVAPRDKLARQPLYPAWR